MRPFQDTVAVCPFAGAAGLNVWITAPSSRRTSLIDTLAAGTELSRNEKVTPPRSSIANSDRLVAVSSDGAPASAGPGAGVSSGLGTGAGGGTTRTDVLLVACALLPAHASTGPLCARIGTATATALSLADCTFTDTSSRLPRPPRNTTFFTPSRLAPRSLILPPLCTAPPRTQRLTHFTALIFGAATYRAPPLDAVAASAAPKLRAASASRHAMRQRVLLCGVVFSLFQRPTGLADGLAPKERRYEWVIIRL